MKELILAAVNRFFFATLHKVNSNCVSQNRASFVRAAMIEKQFLHPPDHEARYCCQTSSHCSDNLQWQHWLSRGRFNIEKNLCRQQTTQLSVGRVCRGTHLSLADEANQVPVTLSCTTVDSIQSTPHTQASRCWLSDRNSTFLWGHMWGSETKPQVACLTTLSLKQWLCNDNSLLCPSVK